MNINEYIPFLILLYTLSMNINGYIPFLILLYTLSMNINRYIPFLMNTLDTIVRWGNLLTKSLTTSSGLPLSYRWWVLYFVML